MDLMSEFHALSFQVPSQTAYPASECPRPHDSRSIRGRVWRRSYARHMFVCGGPDCVDADKGEETWIYVKDRLKALNLTGPNGPVYRTRCKCLRICTGGPISWSTRRARGIAT
jgi:hypothetical protein